MRIGMSCCGEGWGHVARMVAFAQMLKTEHTLFLFAPVEVHSFIHKHLSELPLFTVPSLVLEKKEDKILWLPAIKAGIRGLLNQGPDIKRLKRLTAMLELEAIISDYEPYMPTAARDLDIPVLQINHPGIVVKYMNFTPDAILAGMVAKKMMGPYDERVFISFFGGDCGPIVRKELQQYPLTRGDYLVVSLKPSFRVPVLKTLEKLGITNYILYPDSDKNYAKDLAGCAGVITSAGHQSISECIALRKPIFVIPQRGQYEQRLNAHMLRLSGNGDYSSLSGLEKDLPKFLRDLHLFPKKQLTEAVQFHREDSSDTAMRFIKNFLSKVAVRHWRDFEDRNKEVPTAQGF